MNNYTCQWCDNRGCILESCHIFPRRLYPKLTFNVRNGLCLCEKCHYLLDYELNPWNNFSPELAGFFWVQNIYKVKYNT